MRYKRVENAPNQDFCIKRSMTVFSSPDEYRIENKDMMVESKLIVGKNGYSQFYEYSDIPEYADGLKKRLREKAIQLGWVVDTKVDLLTRVKNMLRRNKCQQ